MKRLVLAASALTAGAFGAGCEPIDLENLLLSCASDDECPDGLVCDEAGLCNPREGDGETVVVTPVALVSSAATTSLVGTPFVVAGAPLIVAFRLNKAIETPPRVALVVAGIDIHVVDAVIDEADGVENGWTASFALDGREPEETARVELRVLDDEVDATTPTTLTPATTVTFDYTGPEPVALSFQRLPDPQRTIVALEILDETDVGPATDVRLVFSSSEPVFLEDGDDEDFVDVDGDGVDDRAPRVVSIGEAAPLDFHRDLRSTNPLIFDLEWPDDVVAGGYDGVHGLQITLVDLAGNEAVAFIDPVDSDGDGVGDAGFVVDGTKPLPPSVDVANSVVFERAPWGRLDVREPDLFRVVGAPGSAEAGALVLVTRGAAGPELDRVVVDVDGSFAAPSGGGGLSIIDIDTLQVRVADHAGNVGDVVAIRDVRWIATPLGKIAGSDNENPHRLHAAPIFAAHLEQGGLEELGDPRTTSTRTTGAGTWRFVDDPVVSLQPALATIVADAAIATDPVHGVTVLLGQREVGRGNDDGTGFVSRGSCNAFINDVKVRGSDGRWRAGPPIALGQQFEAPKATYAAAIAQIVVVAENMQTLTFDGTSWRTLCDDTCGEALPPFGRNPSSVVWDERRGLLVAAVGATIAELDVQQATPKWRNAGTLPQAMQALWDEANDVVVFAAGPQLMAWDGSDLTPLCTGACAETAPAGRSGMKLARDEQRHRFVLYGGEGDVPCRIGTSNGVIRSTELQAQNPDAGIEIAPNATPGPTETWTFDGASWTKHDVSGPGPRTRHAMAWDPLRRRVLLVGGDDCECMEQSRTGLEDAIIPGFANDTWEWDGTSWLRLLDPAAPPAGYVAAVPPALRDHAIAEGLGGAVIVSGSTSLHLFRDDTWWTRADAQEGRDPLLFTQPMVATSPLGRILAVGGALVQGPAMVGGPEPLLSDLSAGRFASPCPETVSDGSEACSAPRRVWGAASWHDGERFYVHGGVERATSALIGNGVSEGPTTGGGTDTLRAFDDDTGWSTVCDDGVCAQTRPPQLMLHRAVLDGDGNAIVFGGILDTAHTSGDTWRWDGATWTKLDGAGPPARAGHLMAWDAERDAVVVAYGADLPAPIQVQTQGSGPPTPAVPRELPAALSTVWELHGDGWREAAHVDFEGDGRPSARSSVAGAGLVGGGVLLMGGTPSPATTVGEVPDFLSTTPRSNEVWVWQGSADDAPGVRFSARADARTTLLRPVDEITGLTFSWRARTGRTNLGAPAAPPHLVWWDGSGWIDVDDDDLVGCGDDCVTAHLGAAEARRALVNTNGNRLAVGMVADANGQAPGHAVIETDDVEVQLTWRRPAPTPESP